MTVKHIQVGDTTKFDVIGVEIRKHFANNDTSVLLKLLDIEAVRQYYYS